jgi:hypothetical protein
MPEVVPRLRGKLRKVVVDATQSIQPEPEDQMKQNRERRGTVCGIARDAAAAVSA